jgi:Rod binding domain-containing protein
MFAGMMLKEMRKTTNGSSLIEKSHATKMYEEMMDESLAKQMAGSGQLGVADQLYDMVKGERIRLELRGNEKNMTRGALEPIKE